MQIPLARPWFGPEALENVRQALESGWVTQGPFAKRFEGQVAKALGLPHALACGSATAALAMALEALDLPAGSEVLVPSFSFPAPVNAIIDRGLIPVFVDVQPHTYNIDPDDLTQRTTEKTRAIVAVHQFGLACDIGPIATFASERGLGLVEDGACALGATRHGQPIGHHGSSVVISFHPRKVVTTGEGGVLSTRDAAIDQRLRAYRAQGVSMDAIDRHRSGAAVLMPSFATPGMNHRMSDLQAAVGCAQMARLDLILAHRRRIAGAYLDAIAALPGVHPPEVPEGYEHTFQTFCCLVADDRPGARDTVVAGLRDRGVASAPGAVTAHREPAYASWARGELPTTDMLAARSFLLPLYPQMTDDEIAHVTASLAEALTD